MASPNIVDYLNRHLRTAGWHAGQMRAGVEIQTKNAVDDFVTQADKEVDLMITAALCKVVPDCCDLSENPALANGLITEESVEKLGHLAALAVATRKNIWYLDAIDGTDNYVKEDGQYSILLGLLSDGEPRYGWVYSPARDELYFGGSSFEISEGNVCAGLWRSRGNNPAEKVTCRPASEPFTSARDLRVIMGSRDRRDNPRLVDRIKPNEWVLVGSLGLKVIALINGEADVYVHPYAGSSSGISWHRWLWQRPLAL